MLLNAGANGTSPAPTNDEADGRAPKRLQRSREDSTSTTPVPSQSTNDLARRQSMAAARRRSGIRDSKAPLGPRPPDFSNSRRIISDSVRPQTDNSSRPFLPPNPTSEPFLGLSSRRHEARFEAQPQSSANTPRHYTPVPDHNMLSSIGGLNLSSTGSAVDQARVENERPAASRLVRAPPKNDVPYTPIGYATRSTTAANRLAEDNSVALRAARLSTQHQPPSSEAAARMRRQSHYPAAPAVEPSFRLPRKSIGPGSLQQSRPQRAGPSQGSNDSAFRFEKERVTNGYPPRDATDGSAVASGYLSNQGHPNTVSSSNQPQNSFDPSQTHPASTFHQPSIPETHKLRKSSFSSPRGGLARAVSPTDAWRAKRASGVRPLYPGPDRSPTPEMVTAPIPAIDMLPPYSKDKQSPPSSRSTPDQNIRFSAGRSLSSRSSYSSLRPASVMKLQHAGPQNGKSDNTISSKPHAKKESRPEMPFEPVPPVPAIPRAYDSPTSTIDEPFFESLEAQPLTSASKREERRVKTLSMAAAAPAVSKRAISPESKFKRRFTLAPRAANGNDFKPSQTSRQSSQPFHLPPLNILPLNDQTTEKIQSMARDAHGRSTPPPKARQSGPPTTPMTASRATFARSGFEQAQNLPPVPRVNSSTSHRQQDASLAPSVGSRSSSATRYLTPSPVNQERPPLPTAAKFKIGALTAQKKQAAPKPEGLDDIETSQHGYYRSWRGRSRASSRNEKKAASTAQIPARELPKKDEPPKAPTPSSRKRMSLRFRRASSKTPNAMDEATNSLNDAAAMPPPKIPASKLWTEPTSLSTSIAERQPPADPSSGSNLAAPRQASVNASKSDSKSTSKTSLLDEKARSTPTNASQTSFSRTPTASKDQLFNAPNEQEIVNADDEMRRLASKRKEFEATARELDRLQRRAVAKQSVSPAQAARVARLNVFERGEIIDYKEVHFCGTKEAKKIVGDLAHHAGNFGFDDERGDYNIVEGDHLAYRYEVIDVLGKGSFGQVVRCIDHKTGKLVAIKIIRNKKRFHQQALVEVNILQRLRDWDPQGRHAMISFTESFYFRSHLCITTELLGMNLYEFIKAHEFRGFSLKLIKRFARQMLACLCVLQAKKVIHCDLKPENILLCHPLQSGIKTIDFGSSCFENEKVYTYIQSRFYRSPEVILGMEYGMPIDMWSMGCILAELLTGFPIFPGENEQEQLACIMEVFGPPEKHLIEKSSRKKVFFDSLGKPRATVSSKGKRRKPSSRTLQQALRCDDEAFLDFLTRCLRWDPDKRMKPDEAMQHDFLTGPKNRSKTSLAPSPAKRAMTFGIGSRTPSASRPLSEPPTASAGSTRQAVAKPTLAPPPASSPLKSSSPMKATIPNRRQSAMPGTNLGTKRTSTGAAIGNGSASGTGPTLRSALPRSVSGKPDLASAAAAASLRNR